MLSDKIQIQENARFYTLLVPYADQQILIKQLVEACEKVLPQIYAAHGDYQEARYIDTEKLESALAAAKEQK